jgi:phosphomannomutase
MTIFREYDVRGVADRDLTDPVIWALGRSLGDLCKAAGDARCYVGSDVRLSSPRLRAALVHGLKDAGLAVGEIETGPTPLLYFAAAQKKSGFDCSSGIMVTGSHNPPEYNGFKMVIGGRTLFGDDIQKLRSQVESYASKAPAKIGASGIKIERIQDYVNFVRDNIKIARKLRVVIDAGNGAAGELAQLTYKALGLDVISLFCEPDGSFPNHHPDPTVPKNLRFLVDKVKETGADVGIGFDGDGDRIGAVSASGRILYGDQLVMYFARDILKELPDTASLRPSSKKPRPP